MIRLTQTGHDVFMQAIQRSAASIRLMTDNGELQGHGYEAKRLDANAWVNGEYPKVVWEFSAGNPVSVVGYFVNDANGSMLFSEDFPEGPQEIKNTGDRIGITIRLSLIAGA